MWFGAAGLVALTGSSAQVAQVNTDVPIRLNEFYGAVVLLFATRVHAPLSSSPPEMTILTMCCCL